MNGKSQGICFLNMCGNPALNIHTAQNGHLDLAVELDLIRYYSYMYVNWCKKNIAIPKSRV